MTQILSIAAGAAGAAAAALFAATFVLGASSSSEDILEGVAWSTAALMLALIGALVAVRRPRNVVGWLLLCAGLAELTAGATTLYGEHVTASGGRLPAAVVVEWAGGTVWAFSVVSLLVLLPLYFPTGRPPTPRWRWVAWAGICSTLLLMGTTVVIPLTHPELVGQPWERIEEVLGDAAWFTASNIGFPLLLGLAPIALLSLGVRFARSTGEERQQIKLLLYAATVTIAFVLVVNTDVVELPRIAEAAVTAVALPSLGVATMVAILRYHLFDIDRVISRTLSYALLSLVLAGVYLAAVTALTALTAPVTGESPIAVAAATLLAAAAFQPARTRIQAGVDKRFNRARYDAQRTLEHFASSLRQEVDIDDVNARLVSTVGEVLQPARIAVWLRPRGANA